MWQKCPICYGEGTIPSKSGVSTMEICPTCKGTRIINELTGFPLCVNTSIKKDDLLSYEGSIEDKYKEIIDKVAEEMQNIEPIYKGCSANGPCFCTGKCKEVVGEKDKTTGKVTYYEKKKLW